ncbi:MAG: tetratricopeptide repeat protein [Pyrinomonadaceae bacterium]
MNQFPVSSVPTLLSISKFAIRISKFCLMTNAKLLIRSCAWVLMVGLASASLAQTIQNNPQTADDYFKRGNDFKNKNDYQKAIADYTEALRLDPKLVKALLNRAVAHFHLRDFDTAIADSTQAIKINPRYAEAYHNRGTAYASKGDHTQGLVDINRAIKLNPRLAEAYFSRGVLSYAREDDDRAIADFTRAIKLDPQLAKAYHNRGLGYYRNKDYELAISDFTQAISLTPNEFMGYWARGGVYAEKREYDRAIADLTKAISLAPNDTKVYSNRAEVYCAQGQKELAAADENKIIELGERVYDRCEASNTPKAGAITGAQLDELCAGIDNSYECAQAIEAYQLKNSEHARRVIRRGVELRLKLNNGRWHTLKNYQRANEDDSVIQYNFREYLPELGYFLVHRQFYEGHDYLMIHDVSGRRFELQDAPVVSPDGRRLVTTSSGIMGGYSPNAIQIWRVTQRGLLLEQTIQPRGWEPSDAKWIDNQKISLTKNLPNADRSATRQAPATLILRGRWRVE